ncbi:MAG: quinone-dependent dihydroorotate dehydrogenase [Cyclobacteriaceae bacterium]|nr:quinone-dependent dihydroorotate dehydrogenase [Cyclobacteriaceae bacterium]MCH8517466.1 quinone-dependent dihydroorotate dehydrogenase [Cyclobacteriaceae bacterium]
MYLAFRKLLFALPPEKAHHTALKLLHIGNRLPFFRKALKMKPIYNEPGYIDFAGIRFPGRVGLAAGFDKNAEHIDLMADLGFAFIEIGTVTPKPQEGNPKPRLFRLTKDEALINRMGFNNGGLDQVIENLKARKSKVIVGGNIGKNKVTPNEEAVSDYLICFKGLYDYVDYFVINVSSPNTPGLRELQDKEPLKRIVSALHKEREKMQVKKPIFLKIAPDLTQEQLDDIISLSEETGLEAVIATNTTLDRSQLLTSENQLKSIGAGGLSGKPLQTRATEVIRYLNEKSDGKLRIIGVGGINSVEDAKQKIEAGAELIQIYTGFIYHGNGLINAINEAKV